jgi:hypothetical protein
MKACRIFFCLANLLTTTIALCQEKKSSLEVHGFIMLDAGYNFNSSDPQWFDVMRPTKLPSTPGQFGTDGNVYFSVRQTRLGFRTITPTALGDIKSNFDIDMFGFGADAGQTTFHIINAFVEWRKILVGQTASAFMNTDILPVTLDYWGPASRNFNFNIQFRYTIINNEKHRLAAGLERPNGKADGGDYRPQLDLENVVPQFVMPNIAAHYRRYAHWGHVQMGGLFKLMKWTDLTGANPMDLSGQAIGWGANASTLIRTGALLNIKAEVVYGEGAQSYIADAPPDVGLQSNFDDPTRPVKGKALPIFGFMFFTEWKWSAKLASTIGYSGTHVTNSDLQDATAFRTGDYGLANLRYYPVDRTMIGIEYLYGRRINYTDNYSPTGNKIQLSFKFNFSSGELTH